MTRYVVRRLLLMVPTFLGITLVTFAVAQLAPGDPLQLDPESASAAAAHGQAVAHFRATHGLDQPLPVQYLRWLGRVATFDFGRSLHDGRAVTLRLAEALPRTLAMSVLALLWAFLVALPLGVVLAVHARRAWARLLSAGLFFAYALPAFWVAVLALLALATDRGVPLFPLQGLYSPALAGRGLLVSLIDLAWHLALPVLCLGYPTLVVLTRHVKSAMQETLTQDFVRALRARGIPERAVVYRHALRNSLLPVVTLLGQALPHLIGGSVVIEQIFGIPGMGLLAFDAVAHRDHPVVMGVATLAALLTMVSVLLADLLYAWADPRIRLGGAR